jgi:hypothetical protein
LFFLPLWGVEALGGFVFALGAAANVEKGFHGGIIADLAVLQAKKNPASL